MRRAQVPYDPDSDRTVTLNAVLALGDSFTLGLGVVDSAPRPARLKRDLRAQAALPVQVANMGTVSYGEFEEMDLLRRKGLVLHRAVGIHALYRNDYVSARRPQPGTPPVFTPGGEFVWEVCPPARGCSW